MNIEAAATESFRLMIKIPPIRMNALYESLDRAIEELQIDEKTKKRDAIQLQLEEKLADSEILGVYYNYVRLKDENASELVNGKNKEIVHLQDIVNSLSIDHINNKISDLDNKIRRKYTWNQINNFMSEINRLERLCEKVSSSSSCADKQLIEVREEAEEFIKIVRKELDVLTDSAVKAKAAYIESKKKYEDDKEQVEKIKAEYRDACNDCSAAIAKKENMKKEFRDRFASIGDCLADIDYAVTTDVFLGDPMRLSRYCRTSVENFMTRWNKDEVLRRQYAEFNESSTMYRFGSLDGCLVDPDYESPILPPSPEVNRAALFSKHEAKFNEEASSYADVFSWLYA